MADEQDPGSEYDFAPREEPQVEPDAVPAVPASEEVAAVPPPRLSAERVCPHCGFEIFGKPRGGRCPDCAAPLDLAGTDLLQFSDGDWVKRLSNGALLFALAIVMDVAGAAVVLSGSWSLGDGAHILAAAIGAWGIWLATTKEDNFIAEPSPTATPARAASLTVLALWIVLSLVALTQYHGAIKFFTILVLLAYAAEAILFGFHLQKLANRIPNDSLAAQSLNLAWFMPGFCFVLMGVNFFDLAVGAALTLFFCAFPLIGGLLIMIIWSLSVLIRMGLELRTAAEAGESIAIKKAQRLAQKK
jgi:hypothetical protein